jgi:hypothetical protein
VEAAFDTVDDRRHLRLVRALQVGCAAHDARRVVVLRQVGVDQLDLLLDVLEVGVLRVVLERAVEVDLRERRVDHREHQAEVAGHQGLDRHARARRRRFPVDRSSQARNLLGRSTSRTRSSVRTGPMSSRPCAHSSSKCIG